MSKRSVYNVGPAGDGQWEVKRRGAERASNVFDDKRDAIDRAKELAKSQQPSQVVIKKSDGTIQTEYTYQDDPYPPKG